MLSQLWHQEPGCPGQTNDAGGFPGTFNLLKIGLIYSTLRWA